MNRTAVLLMAYGTPRSTQEILPYYTDIRRGRAPTDEQLADLVARYDAIGGISPLAARTEAQRDALQRALDALNPGQFHVQLGLKHAAPMIETAVTIWHNRVSPKSLRSCLRRIFPHIQLDNMLVVPLRLLSLMEWK